MIVLAVVSFITSFTIMWVSLFLEQNGEDNYPSIVKEWLNEDYGIEVPDDKALQVLLTHITSDEYDPNQDSEIFVKGHGVLKLIPGGDGQYYLTVNGQAVKPSK